MLRRIAETTRADQGAGAIPAVVRAALPRLIGFELQFGPFAVAQLRLMAEVADLLRVRGTVPQDVRLRLYVTNTLGPPYKEKAKGRGGWVESGSAAAAAPLARWLPPPDWGVGAHAKHLRNLYVYFWRWATWKVFGDAAAGTDQRGIVCFITVAGFLNGLGFQAMRDHLRRSTDELWVVGCSPEGHQPAVASRVF